MSVNRFRFMPTVFSSSLVRPARSAKSPLVRALVWTLGIQAALGGTLIMIHERVFESDAATGSGIVCVNFIESSESSEKSEKPSSRSPRMKISSPALIAHPQENAHEDEQERELVLASADVAVPETLPQLVENPGLFLSREDFGDLLDEKAPPTKKKSLASSEKAVRNEKSGSSSSLAGSPSPPKKGEALAATVSARYKSAPLPPYPRAARSEGREGVVMLKVLIDPTGKPRRVSIAKSSGSLVLDDTALDWVKNNWLFYPAMNETGPVESAMIAPLRFKLRT